MLQTVLSSGFVLGAKFRDLRLPPILALAMQACNEASGWQVGKLGVENSPARQEPCQVQGKEQYINDQGGVSACGVAAREVDRLALLLAPLDQGDADGEQSGSPMDATPTPFTGEQQSRLALADQSVGWLVTYSSFVTCNVNCLGHHILDRIGFFLFRL